MVHNGRAALFALIAALSTPAVSQVQSDPTSRAERSAPAAALSRGDDVIGDDFYCKQRKLGTHFYCGRAKPKPVDPSALPAAPPVSYAAQLKELQGQIEETRAKAVLAPTAENITAYIALQREQLDRSSYFADIWQRAIWANPNLDYTLQRPVSTVGKRLWADNREQDKTALLTNLSKRYAIDSI